MLEKRPLSTFLLLSVLAHCVVLCLSSLFRTMDLTAPVQAAGVISVELEGGEGASRAAAGTAVAQGRVQSEDSSVEGTGSAGASPPSCDEEEGATFAEPAPAHLKQEEARVAASLPEPRPQVAPATDAPAPPIAQPKEGKRLNLPSPLRQGREFVTATRETLTYRIVMHGVKVGEASLDARNDNGAVRIVMKVASAPWVSAFYPVDDEIQTQLVAGNYLVVSIRQLEGKYRGDTGFTLMLREKKAFSTKNLVGGQGLVTEPLPRSDVTDLISGFYYLRNQPLEAGKTVLLHLYDSGKYAPTTVEVLRRERIEVAGLGEVATLVILPRLKTAGIFRRTGDILIWLTDDDRKVPVRVETTIPIGKVRADLVSSEVEKAPEGAVKKAPDVEPANALP